MACQGTRWTEAASDVSLFTENKERDTSVGIRMQLWHASWLMFKQSPLVGVGVPNFRRAGQDGGAGDCDQAGLHGLWRAA